MKIMMTMIAICGGGQHAMESSERQCAMESSESQCATESSESQHAIEGAAGRGSVLGGGKGWWAMDGGSSYHPEALLRLCHPRLQRACPGGWHGYPHVAVVCNVPSSSSSWASPQAGFSASGGRNGLRSLPRCPSAGPAVELGACPRGWDGRVVSRARLTPRTQGRAYCVKGACLAPRTQGRATGPGLGGVQWARCGLAEEQWAGSCGRSRRASSNRGQAVERLLFSASTLGLRPAALHRLHYCLPVLGDWVDGRLGGQGSGTAQWLVFAVPLEALPSATAWRLCFSTACTSCRGTLARAGHSDIGCEGRRSTVVSTVLPVTVANMLPGPSPKEPPQPTLCTWGRLFLAAALSLQHTTHCTVHSTQYNTQLHPWSHARHHSSAALARPGAHKAKVLGRLPLISHHPPRTSCPISSETHQSPSPISLPSSPCCSSPALLVRCGLLSALPVPSVGTLAGASRSHLPLLLPVESCCRIDTARTPRPAVKPSAGTVAVHTLARAEATGWRHPLIARWVRTREILGGS